LETRPVLPVPACEHCGSTEWTATEQTRETESSYKLVDGAWVMVEEGTPDNFWDYYCAKCEQQPNDDDVIEALESIPLGVAGDDEEEDQD
jgi:hypothetical protein